MYQFPCPSAILDPSCPSLGAETNLGSPLPSALPRCVSRIQPQEYVAVAAVVVYIGAIAKNDHFEKIPMVARVCIVDYRGKAILDTFVRPTHRIENYRVAETGLQHSDLANAPHFRDIQLRVADLIQDKILVGHGLWNFLSVLGLSHPALRTRDLALFRPFRKKLRSKSAISLPTLVHLFMGRNIGMDYENPLEIARASVDLFRCCEELFETAILDGEWPCNLPPSDRKSVV